MPRTSVRILAAAIVAVLLLANAPAQATAISKNFNATASVAANCQMSAVGDLSFGAYDPVVANATSGLTGNTSFTLKCTRGASPVISLSVSNLNFGQNVASPSTVVGANIKGAGALHNFGIDLDFASRKAEFYLDERAFGSCAFNPASGTALPFKGPTTARELLTMPWREPPPR